MNSIPNRTVNILLAGVGGQGTILAGELLSHVLLEDGYDVKKSDVHGMAQRGGRVVSHVRFGQRVFSPLIVPGEVDILVAFEMAEALRSLDWLAPKGRVIAENRAILPYSSQVGESAYPFDALEKIEKSCFDLTVVEGEKLAREAGSGKAANVVLMGALARCLPVGRRTWEDAIRRNMRENVVEINLRAFAFGWEKAVPSPEERVQRGKNG